MLFESVNLSLILVLFCRTRLSDLFCDQSISFLFQCDDLTIECQ